MTRDYKLRVLHCHVLMMLFNFVIRGSLDFTWDYYIIFLQVQTLSCDLNDSASHVLLKEL